MHLTLHSSRRGTEASRSMMTSGHTGVLFVDEAYALVKDPKDSFGREALDALIKQIEDRRDDLVVVLAGYSAEMAELLDANPGVRSRFPTVIHFEDYDAEELMAIAEGLLAQRDLVLAPAARTRLAVLLAALSEKPGLEHGAGPASQTIASSL